MVTVLYYFEGRRPDWVCSDFSLWLLIPEDGTRQLPQWGRSVCGRWGDGCNRKKQPKQKPEDFFHGKTIVVGRLIILIWEDFFFFFLMCRDTGILCCVWFGGYSEPANFLIGLQCMPSIPSNLISLDTNMALLARRLVAYPPPEENLCPWATWSTDLISSSVQNLLRCTYLRGLYIVKELQD